MRKRRLTGLAAIAAGMGLLGPVTWSGLSQAAPTTVTVSNLGMQSLDPTQWGAQILIDQGTILEGLVGYNRDNQFVPKIAQRWVASDGNRVWTFYLRKNARWSNGAPVTAEDFYYAWMRLASPQDATGAIWASPMNWVKNAWNYHLGAVPASQVGLKVVNPYELRVTLTTPTDIIPDLVLAAAMPLYPPDVKNHGTQWYMPKYFVGDAPYVVQSFVPNGRVVLTRNPHYVGNPNEYDVGNVDRIVIQPQSSVPVEDFVSGKTNVASIYNPSDYTYVLKHPSLKRDMHERPIYEIQYLEWDKSTEPSVLDKPMVRRAIAMAVNRGPLVNPVLDGLGGATDVFGTPGWPTVSGEHAPPYNVQAARKLLAKAGYPNGRGIPTLTLYTEPQGSSLVSVAEAIAQELKAALNIHFRIVTASSSLYWDITWGQLNKGVAPGYNVGIGVTNWGNTNSLDMGAGQIVGVVGSIGPVPFRQHAAQYYEDTYAPSDVKLMGNPADPHLGTTASSWKVLDKVAAQDIAYLNAWDAKQPEPYRSEVTPNPSYQSVWNGFKKQWNAAKTASARHQIWVEAWKYLGDGGGSVGLNGKVYADQHEGPVAAALHMLQTEQDNAATFKDGVRYTEALVNLMMSQGLAIPLYYSVNVYLVSPDVHQVQVNPWNWNNFYQLQYLTVGK